MNEKTLQDIFERYLISHNIPYEREFRSQTHPIDFRIKINDKICGVEVKSSNGEVFNAIGQLIFAKRTFSNVYLLAPEEFLKKIQTEIENMSVGVIMFKDGAFTFLREPVAPTYYFNQPQKQEKPMFQRSKSKNLLIVDRDYSILLNFENKIFSCLDVINLFKSSRMEAYIRIQRLLKVGLIEEVSSLNPKTYRVKKIVDWGIKIPLPQSKQNNF